MLLATITEDWGVQGMGVAPLLGAQNSFQSGSLAGAFSVGLGQKLQDNTGPVKQREERNDVQAQETESRIEPVVPTEANPQEFLNQTFLSAPPPALDAPAPRRQRAHVRSASAEPSRKSLRQAAKKSVIPIAHRATHRLIR